MQTPHNTHIENGRELVLRVWYNPTKLRQVEITDALGETMRAFGLDHIEADVPNNIMEGDYDWAFDLALIP